MFNKISQAGRQKQTEASTSDSQTALLYYDRKEFQIGCVSSSFSLSLSISSLFDFVRRSIYFH